MSWKSIHINKLYNRGNENNTLFCRALLITGWCTSATDIATFFKSLSPSFIFLRFRCIGYIFCLFSCLLQGTYDIRIENMNITAPKTVLYKILTAIAFYSHFMFLPITRRKHVFIQEDRHIFGFWPETFFFCFIQPRCWNFWHRAILK